MVKTQLLHDTRPGKTLGSENGYQRPFLECLGTLSPMLNVMEVSKKGVFGG